MASYTVNCEIADFGMYWYGKGQDRFVNRAFDVMGYFDDYQQNTLARYDQSKLNTKKKKRIDSISFRFPTCTISYESREKKALFGGTVSALKTPFRIGVQEIPENIIYDFKYKEYDKKQIKPEWFDTKYFYQNDNGYFGGKLYRSFYEQMAIGFLFANIPPWEVRREIDWYWTRDEDYLPYIEFKLSDFDTVTPFSPIDGAYVNPTALNNFVVSFDAFDSIEHPTVTQAQVEVRNVATSAVTPVTGTMSVNLRGRNTVEIPIPANTMQKNNDYQWRAKLIHNDGETGWTDWSDFTTSEAIPNAPIIKAPQSAYLDAAQPITLTWEHDIDTGSAQHAYDLAYRQNGDWVTLANHLVSPAQSRIIPANTLTSGNFVWRVRTYNIDDVPGPYAESATNVVQAPPQRPIINAISTTPVVTVSWQSSGQQAWELYIGDRKIYNFGVDKSYQLNDYLPDGSYLVKLRIQNALGLWSDYTTATIQVKNTVLPGEDILFANPVPGGVSLQASLPPVAESAKYVGEVFVGETYVAHIPSGANGARYILRDGVPIAKLDGTAYTDYTAAGLHEYKLRVVRGGNYYDSPAVYAAPSIRYGVISSVGDLSQFFPLAYRLDAIPRPQKRTSKNYNTHYFSGRPQPVFDVTEHYDTVWDIENIVRRENIRTLQTWANNGAVVLIRYKDGTKIQGIIQSLSTYRVTGDIYSASFSVQESDYSEVIPYV